MADFYWPTLLEPASSRLEILSSAGRFQSPTSGFTRTISRPGERMRLTLSFENTNGAMRAALQLFLAGMRGAVHRVLAHDHSNRIRGSFPSSELLSNPTFQNGTTGWSSNSIVSLSVADRICRALRIANTGATFGLLSNSSAVSVTQYAPHVLRAFVTPGRGSFGNLGLRFGSAAFSIDYGSVATLPPGLLTFAVVLPAATTFVGLIETAATGLIAGEYAEIPYLSLSRCALVDNGPNALLHSDDFTNAAWINTRTTDAANSTVAPDGTTTADSIIEDATASSTHFIQQGVTVSSAALDYSFTVALKLSTRTFATVSMVESTGSHECFVDVNLTTGALGTPTAGGANWTNPRAFVRNMGNGWFAVTIVGRKASVGTVVTPRIYIAFALGQQSYSGDGTSLIFAWRATLAQSSVPTRLVQTTTTALPTGASQALSGGLHTKGWPASTNGLLLPGDQVQIGSQLLIVTAALNSDAAGLGFLQLAPALRSAPADNAPVVINQPMGKFFLESDANGWGNKPGIFSDAEVVLAEAA